MRTKRRLIVPMLLVLAMASGCAKKPPDLTPEMGKVWQAKEAVANIRVLVASARALNETTVCKPSDTGIPVCKPILDAKNENVVLDGSEVAYKLLDTTPANWKVITDTFLGEVEGKLDDYGKGKFLPYIQGVRTALALLAR